MMILASCLLACAAAVDGQLTTPSDTVVYHAVNAPRWGEDLVLVEELRIGSVDGSGGDVFGRIGGIAEDANGTLYVLDTEGPVVAQFDRDGRFLRRLGRPGSGPGEYDLPAGIEALPSGGVAIWDLGNTRITTYDSNGEHASTYRIDIAAGRASGSNLQVDTAGRFYVRSASRSSRRVPGRSGLAELWIGLDPRTGGLDTISLPAERHEGPAYVLSANTTPRWPFTTSTIASLSPHAYLVVGRNTEYALHRPLPDGRVFRIERPYAPVRVGASERSEWEDATHRLSRASPLGPLAETRVPTEKPPFRGFFVDDDGRIWVSRYVEAVQRSTGSDPGAERLSDAITWREPSTWDVFDPRGPFLGTVTTPDRSRVLAVRGRHLWAVEAGTYDVPILVRYSIRARVGS